MNMKNSGIDHIGEIPEHWEIKRVKDVFISGRGQVISKNELKKEKEAQYQYPVYSSATKNYGCIGYLSSYAFNKKIITWTTDGVNAGTVFYREGYFNCTNVCGTLLPKNSENLIFFTYLIGNQAPFYKRRDINGAKIMNNEMGRILIPVPPLSEQEKIANFLDEKVTKIDRVIELGEQRIKSLNEYKTSLIYETVTKGLNKDAILKESGIEWVGVIPEHWEIKKLKKCISFLTTGKLDVNQAYPVGKYPFFSCSEKQTLFSNNYAFSGESLIIIGNGNPGFVSYYNGEFNAYQRTYVLQGGECLKFLFYNIKALFKQHTTLSGSVIKYIKLGDFNNYMVCLPPKEEQQAIADYLDKETSFIDREISILKKQTESFKKYKESLIYECVTGKYNIPE